MTTTATTPNNVNIDNGSPGSKAFEGVGDPLEGDIDHRSPEHRTGNGKQPRRLRVLVAHNYYQHAGGEDAVVANEMELLSKRGHDVTLHSVDNHAIAGIAEKLRTFRDVAYSKSARSAFFEKIAQVRPDIVHVHNFFPLLTTSIYDACRDHGVPVVQTLHNFRITCAGALLLRDGKLCEKCVDGSPYWGVVHRCYRGSLPGSLALARMIEANRQRGVWRDKVDAFIALSQSAKVRYGRAGVPLEKILVKPNFAPDPGPPSSSMPRHGALYVGRLSPEKGVRELIKAWHAVAYPLTIAGDGPLGEELRASAPANVTFLGRITPEDVRVQMQNAALLVSPSNCLEAFPVALAEAFAAGLPAIVSDIGSPPEIVEHGRTGLHVPVGDTHSLASAVSGLVADPARLVSFGLAARETYLERYTPDANYARLMEIYRHALTHIDGAQAKDQASNRPAGQRVA